MNHFSIRDIENLSGIKAHTLRIWEQRYNICLPKRKESNHRFYDSEDLKSILKFSYLYHRGIKISKLAKFINTDLNGTAEAHFKMDNSNEHFVTRLAEASIDFDELKFEEVFNEAVSLHGMEVTVTDIIYPYLEKIGLLWLTDHVIPAQEHFTSNLINRKIIAAIDALEKNFKHDAKQIVLFAPEKEHHEIPLLLLHFLWKKNGHRVIYFGVNTTIKRMKLYIDEKPATHLHFHLITNLTSQTPDEYLATLSEEFPTKQIVVSGPVAGDVTGSYRNVTLLKSREEVLSFVEE